jgi:hypothetical protein
MKFYETSDKFLVQLADILNVKINQIKTKDNFIGKAKLGFYICNLDDVTGPGTHWVTFLVLDKYVVYYDPFGLSVPKQVITFIGKNRQIVYNSDQIQHIKSEACGYYNIDFIQWFSKFKSSDLNSIRKIGHHLSKYAQEYNINDRSGNEKILYKRLKNILI